MNKRQRKKRYNRETKQITNEFFHMYPESYWIRRARWFKHPRRHWFTQEEWARKKQQFKEEKEAERAAIHKKLETHHYTLAGWIPKREAEQKKSVPHRRHSLVRFSKSKGR